MLVPVHSRALWLWQSQCIENCSHPLCITCACLNGWLTVLDDIVESYDMLNHNIRHSLMISKSTLAVRIDSNCLTLNSSLQSLWSQARAAVGLMPHYPAAMSINCHSC